MRAFVLALQLLTRLPVPLLGPPPQPQELGLSVLFFPVVGAVIGALLAGLHTALWLADPGVLAGLTLTVWVILTGGLHLDGLADSADAWIGGQGDRDRTLAIMKDPRSGPIAVVAIGLVLLNKFAALQVLLAGDGRTVLLLAPLLGRAVMVLLLVTTPYVRSKGLGEPYALHLPRTSCGLMVLASAVTAVMALGWPGAALLVLLGVGFFGLRHGVLARLGGVTGDTLGAACELTETGVLLVSVLVTDLEMP
ncbi:MAG: adenosylcobinamide-GDP ribazoletransferase [Candidatus Competibacteraceae bacterium]|nr:adenosylcobinamide-GDP ribazoletransferase [Candidatus Competibacteraceae bacterium]MBK9951543.1 adenosylcobinamide-GDP ribazoletransferase [Candidatus Competibacteraceae bacterium]